MAKQFAYTVHGYWPFPIDMLRHDGSRAATTEDQALIDRLSGEFAPDRAAFVAVDINLIGPNKPNTARWESFDWTIPADAEYAMLKRRREEERKRRALLNSAMSKLSPEEREVVESSMKRDG